MYTLIVMLGAQAPRKFNFGGLWKENEKQRHKLKSQNVTKIDLESFLSVHTEKKASTKNY